MKGQVLADFVAKFSPRREVKIVCHAEVWPWKVFVDGASSALGAGVGIVIITPEGIQVEHFFGWALRLPTMRLNMKPYLPD